MRTLAIGDVQGCYDTLMRLLTRLDFDEHRDRLWFVGDLVNRGPQSLATLRFVKSLRDATLVVLGNHDMHLLAVRFTSRAQKPGDTIDQILAADDCDELLDWLRRRPLLHRDDHLGYVMTHAGVPHIWTLSLAERLALEVERTLAGDDFVEFLRTMYGNKPSRWSEDLTGTDRLRVITNYLVRMRVINDAGDLELEFKGGLEGLPRGFFPWFHAYRGRPPQLRLVFGHWAGLNGLSGTRGIEALDTGCVWGNALTALDLATSERVSEPSVK
jgi:bis(5'-nucleosyl)-tetraphosphatase (symmetrical)